MIAIIYFYFDRIYSYQLQSLLIYNRFLIMTLKTIQPWQSRLFLTRPPKNFFYFYFFFVVKSVKKIAYMN